jgi:ketosteroid isomerase-like protein
MANDTDSLDVVQRYFTAQTTKDVDASLALLDDAVVFDVGRGRYEGKDAVRSFMEMLARKNTATVARNVAVGRDGQVVAELENQDDDLNELGIESLILDAEISVEGGRITRFQARPTPESLAQLEAARAAERSAESLRLAEEAGTLPPDERQPRGEV